jgi:hypothetical protein
MDTPLFLIPIIKISISSFELSGNNVILSNCANVKLGVCIQYLGEIKQGVLSVVCDKVTLPFSMETTLF